MLFINNQKRNIILWGLLFVLLIHLLFVFCSFYFNDDINYSRYAAGIVNHGISFEPAKDSYQQLRWTPIYVTAFFYKIFGINAFASTICSFISILLCGVILKRIVNIYKPTVYFLSLALFFFAHSIIFYMHRLLPDAPMCLAVLWMYSSYRSYTIKQCNHLKYALQFAAAFLLATITKENIIIVIPLFAIFFIWDISKKKYLFFWLYATLSTLVLVGIYLLYFKLTTGSFFYRYHLIQADGYLNGCSFDQLPFSFTLKRIGYELWQAMLLNGDLLIFLPAVAAFIYRKKLKLHENVSNIDFYAFIILLLSSNFMTISFTSYVPLCQDPRHFIFLFPFAAIIAGPLVYAYAKDPTKFLLLPIFIVLATLSMFYQHAGSTKYLYLLFSLFLLLRLVFVILDKNKIIPTLFIGSICVLLFCNYLIDIVKPPYPYYWSHKRVIENSFAGKNITATVFSADANSAEMTEYFLGFKTGNLRILPIDSAKAINLGSLYYLIVGDLNSTLQMRVDSLKNSNIASRLLLIDKEQNVSLYKLDDSTLQLLR